MNLNKAKQIINKTKIKENCSSSVEIDSYESTDDKDDFGKPKSIKKSKDVINKYNENKKEMAKDDKESHALVFRNMPPSI